jgi:ankyrin repeat protein
MKIKTRQQIAKERELEKLVFNYQNTGLAEDKAKLRDNLFDYFKKDEFQTYIKEGGMSEVVAKKYQPEIILLLLESQGGIDFQDNDGNTAAHYAMDYLSPNIILLKELEKKGANLNLKNNNGETILHKAAVTSTPEVLEFINNSSNLDHSIVNDNKELPINIAINRYNHFLSQDNKSSKVLEMGAALKIFDDKYSQLFMTSIEAFGNQIKDTLENLQKNKSFSVLELIKNASATVNEKQQSEFNQIINTAWNVAEEAARKGDITLKANLTYYALTTCENILNSEFPHPIVAINSKFFPLVHFDNNSSTNIANNVLGFWIEKYIAVSFSTENINDSVNTLMHEVLHDTIQGVYQNSCLPHEGKYNNQEFVTSNSLEASLDPAHRQIKSFTEDMKELHRLALTEEEKFAIIEECYNRLNSSTGDLILPNKIYKDLSVNNKHSQENYIKPEEQDEFKSKDLSHKITNSILDRDKEKTKKNFREIISDIYIKQGGDNTYNHTIDLNTNNRYPTQKITFNDISVRGELYTFLIGQKAEEYTNDLLKNGKITKDSATIKYAPNITKSFEEDFAKDILPALEEKIELITKDKGIKIAGLEIFEKQIKDLKEKITKEELTSKPRLKRAEETQELKSWSQKFKPKEISEGSSKIKPLERAKTLEDIKTKKESSNKSYAENVSNKKSEDKSWKK